MNNEDLKAIYDLECAYRDPRDLVVDFEYRLFKGDTWTRFPYGHKEPGWYPSIEYRYNPIDSSNVKSLADVVKKKEEKIADLLENEKNLKEIIRLQAGMINQINQQLEKCIKERDEAWQKGVDQAIGRLYNLRNEGPKK